MIMTPAANLGAFVALMRDPVQRYRVYLDETDRMMNKCGVDGGNWKKLCETRSALIAAIVTLQIEHFDRETAT